MMKFASAWMLSLLFVIAACRSLGEIDPSYYVWVQYDAQVQIGINKDGKYEAKIPCQARIGTCRYNYISYPLGWQKGANGALILPQEAARKSGSYAVKVELSEQTGEKMIADLVVTISNGALTVMDSVDYYRKMGLDYKNAEGSKYETSVLVKSVPDGFYSLQQVERKLSSGDERQIKKLVSEVTDKYAPCRSRINYLTSVKQIFNKLITANNNKISKGKSDIDDLEKQLGRLKVERVDILRKKGINQELSQIQARIRTANSEYVGLKSEEFKYQGLAKWALKKLKGEVESDEDVENKNTLKKMQDIQAKFNRWLAQAVQDRVTLRKGILDINLLKETKTLTDRSQAKPIGSSYNSSVLLLIENEAKLTQNLIKLADQEQEQQEADKFLAYVDDRIAYYSVTNSEKAARAQNENQIISQQLVSLQEILGKINNGCA